MTIDFKFNYHQSVLIYTGMHGHLKRFEWATVMAVYANPLGRWYQMWGAQALMVKEEECFVSHDEAIAWSQSWNDGEGI